jgi:hypothetical protein
MASEIGAGLNPERFIAFNKHEGCDDPASKTQPGQLFRSLRCQAGSCGC